MKKLIATLLLIPAIANAEFWSGNMLLQRINSTDNFEKVIALGYVMGVSDVYQNKGHCASTTVTAGQTRDVVKLYLERNPSTRNLAADLLVLVALNESFPCPKSETKPNGRGA